MSTDAERWQPYVPAVLLDDHRHFPVALAPGHARRISAAAMFLDIAGFTAMSEALATLGRAGTERLTAILNDFFEPTIECVHDYGGDVATFAGDAVTVLFPATDGHGPATQRAVACGLELQGGMGRYAAMATDVGTFSLHAKAGVDCGAALAVVVGTDDRRLAVVVGDAVRGCADAEHHARRGEVVVTAAAARQLGAAVTESVADGYVRVRSAPSPPPAVRLPSSPATDGGETLARFLHPVVADRIATGRAAFVDEHRKVTTVFAQFSGVDDARPDAAAKLQEYLGAVLPVVEYYGGSLVHAAVGDKGSTYMAIFGAPVAHDDDEARAVACALALRDVDAATRMGVATGVAYCGHLGSSRRREYTVLGDAVNLAARLMQAARPGQILVDEATRQAAERRVVCQPLEPITVKGKTAAVAVAEVQRLRDRRQPVPDPRETSLVGRDAELNTARRLFDDAARSRGAVLAVSGVAGVGKSRLVAAVVDTARKQGLAVHASGFEAYGTAGAYGGWRDVWWSLLDLPPRVNPADATARLNAVLGAIDPHLPARTPLLGPVLGIDVPDTDFTRNLEPRLRVELLHSLLAEVLRARSRARPRLLVIEDCHWADQPSLALLGQLTRTVADLPVVLLATTRPDGDPLEAFTGLRHATRLQLTELGADAANALVVDRCRRAGAEPHPAFVRAVVDRSSGNPLFVEGIVDLVLTRGEDPTRPPAAGGLDLPDSLGSVLLARIDQLPADEQLTLKLGSVLGRRFPVSWLAGSFPDVGPPAEVRRRLDSLSRQGLMPREMTDPEPTYAFHHAALQEVAYDTLSFRMRQNLHRAAGVHLERVSASNLAAHAELLAHHFGHTTDVDRQMTYFLMAGNKAKAAYANDDAICWYERLQRLGTGGAEDEIALKLGEVYDLVGRWSDAEDLYRRAAAGRVPAVRVRAQVALGNLLAATDTPDAALPWLHRARDQALDIGDETLVDAVLDRLAWVHTLRGDPTQALAYAGDQLIFARRRGDAAGQARALDGVGRIEWFTGKLDDASLHLTEAYHQARDLGDLRLAVHAANNLSCVYADDGKAVQAAEWIATAADLARRIGYQQAVAQLLGNESCLRLPYGDVNGAVACAWGAIDILAELGDIQLLAGHLPDLAAALAAAGFDNHAEGVYRRAADLGRRAGQQAVLCGDLVGFAAYLADREQWAEAAALASEARELAEQVQRDDVAFDAALLVARLDAERGERSIAAVVGDLGNRLADETNLARRAALHYERWRLDHSLDTDRRAATDGYADLYRKDPQVKYKRRYEELTGEPLDLPGLELPPAPTPERSFNPDDVLRLVDSLDTTLDATVQDAGDLVTAQ